MNVKKVNAAIWAPDSGKIVFLPGSQRVVTDDEPDEEFTPRPAGFTADLTQAEDD